jgi:hypothetical protein
MCPKTVDPKKPQQPYCNKQWSQFENIHIEVVKKRGPGARLLRPDVFTLKQYKQAIEQHEAPV